ncbi:MAG: hypothetical protein CMJ64_19855 [Planctomycetaceae bacterium]|nr:hypothetical protein [Planctomycetaceae bacterium]
MYRSRAEILQAAFLFGFIANVAVAGPAYTDPAKADPDFALQGEYTGMLATDDGDIKFGVQVIALGKGKFDSVAYVGGLPGDGWNEEEKFHAPGELKDGVVYFKGDAGTGELKDGVLSVLGTEDNAKGALKKVERKSPTLGQKPPQDAVVLFDGTNADGWKGGKITDDGLLMQGTTSEKTFGSHTLHIEFRLPYQPEDRGQGRGNSGIYFQGRYEVQMLDSFGLEGKQNECGGIYSVAEPDVNMCLPPLSWQTYDTEYTAAKYDDAGKLVANPRITVKHNGVVIHDDIELPGERNTTAAPLKAGPEPGPVYLQNHANPVRYRNIWVVPK